MQPGLHGPDRDADDGGDLGQLEAGVVVQDEDRAVLRRQPFERSVEGVPVVDRDALDRAFERLTPQQRAVFVLHHHTGLPLAEIADLVGVPVGTVKSRLHYATRTLRTAIVADSQVDSTEARLA